MKTTSLPRIRPGLARLALHLLAGALTFQAALAAPVSLLYEVSASAEGPWRPVSAADQVRQADGSISVDGGGNRFYRLRIHATAQTNPPAVVNLGSLADTTAVRLAARLPELSRFLRPILVNPADGTNAPTQSLLSELPGVAAWKDAVISSNAVPVYDPAWQGGAEPAYVEIKVVAGGAKPLNPGLRGSIREQDFDRGSLLLSLSGNELGIPYFSSRGETPSERLVAQLGLTDGAGRRVLTPPAGHRVMRFGPSLYVLEDGAGAAVASLGAQPLRPPRDFVTRFPAASRGGGGQGGSEPSTNPANGIALGFGGYTNYAEFKQDYLSNPAYQSLRARRAARASAEADLEAGRIPAAPIPIRLTPGTSTNLLAGTAVDRFFLDDDDADIDADPFVSVTTAREGGVRVVANRLGDGDLTIRSGRQLARYRITVGLVVRPGALAGAETFTPGWQEPQVWSAGGYDEQPRYWQVERDRWCDAVGCGPTAWAILLAWWDRHGVPSAFTVGTGGALRQSLRTQDAPFYLDEDEDPAGFSRVVQLYDVLHDSCDVICPPFTDAGATAPGDMVEGWWAPTARGRRTDAQGNYFAAPLAAPPDPVMGCSYSWAWDTLDPDWSEPSNVARRANKKGRPAIVGLGWLWHYGVAYAYRRQEYKATADGPVLAVRRWFKVNEGWGKDHGEWYSGDDLFLGFDLKLTQRHLPPP